MISRLLALPAFFSLPLLASPNPVPDSCRALLIAQTDSWSSSHAPLRLFHRTSPSAPWVQVGSNYVVHLGRKGLAWGRGLHPPQSGPQKKEGDKKSPAGLFQLGNILYGYAARSPIPGWRYRQVTDRDLWIEDSSSPLYNRHLILSAHEPFPKSELYHLMRQADPAHELKLFIRHNAPPDVQAGSGSAIFFHLCRGQDSVTTGCSSMEESSFHALLQSFQPKDNPVYVLLPRDDYSRLKVSWKLP